MGHAVMFLSVVNHQIIKKLIATSSPVHKKDCGRENWQCAGDQM